MPVIIPAAPTVTLEQLAGYVGSAADDPALPDALTLAVEMVTDVFASAYRPVPEAVINQLVLEVGNEIVKRRDSTGGASQFVAYDGGPQPVQGPRDPLQRVWPIIRRYVVPL